MDPALHRSTHPRGPARHWSSLHNSDRKTCARGSQPGTISFVNGPGLRKAGAAPEFLEHTVTYVRSEDAHWREAFARADIVSEGKTEAGAYLGSTSIVLRTADTATRGSDVTAALAAQCMHVRLRALRIARREAQNRAGRSLHPSRCDLSFLKLPDGVKIEVNVEANLVERRHRVRNVP
jgi:hypothetical protein